MFLWVFAIATFVMTYNLPLAPLGFFGLGKGGDFFRVCVFASTNKEMIVLTDESGVSPAVLLSHWTKRLHISVVRRRGGNHTKRINNAVACVRGGLQGEIRVVNME